MILDNHQLYSLQSNAHHFLRNIMLKLSGSNISLFSAKKIKISALLEAKEALFTEMMFSAFEKILSLATLVAGIFKNSLTIEPIILNVLWFLCHRSKGFLKGLIELAFKYTVISSISSLCSSIALGKSNIFKM